MTTAHLHALAFERTSPVASAAVLVVATALALTGALRSPLRLRDDRPAVTPVAAAPTPLVTPLVTSAAPAPALADARTLAAPTPAASHDAPCPPRWTIRFRRGSWSTPPRLVLRFASLRSFLLANPRANARVLGYADPLGADRDNQALSLRRAAAVAASIRRARVPMSRVVVGGVDAFTDEPASATDPDALRRVEVRVRGVAPCADLSSEIIDP